MGGEPGPGALLPSPLAETDENAPQSTTRSAMRLKFIHQRGAFRIDLVDEKPIRLDMTFTAMAPVPHKPVIPLSLGQWLFVGQEPHDRLYLADILSTAAHPP